MTRLTEVKQQHAETVKQLQTTETAALLALISKPDAAITVRDKDVSGSYRIEAYGLKRADGGYILQRFRCKGQQEQIAFWTWEQWRAFYQRIALFADAVSAINMQQHALLERATL